MSLLSLEGVTAHYEHLQALSELSLELSAGETLAVIGANGAGKSTLLSLVSGELRPTKGRVIFQGRDITSHPPHRRVSDGIALVPEGRHVFDSLTVEENLLVGAASRRKGHWDLGAVYGLFPFIRERRRHRAGQLSGGEQQAVAIGRALMANPVLLLLDEVSLGLAPVVVRDLYVALRSIVAEGTTLLLVEQDLTQALEIADQVICLLEGRVVLSAEPSALDAAAVTAAYFGRSSGTSAQETATAPADGGTSR
jgi:branched-chain amino acid transport system ATP-binding protein